MRLSRRASVYICAAALAGVTVAVRAGIEWHSADAVRFLAFLLVTAIASSMKVMLPGIKGSISVSYIFILSGVIQLSFAEAVSIAIVSALVQSYWGAKQRPKGVQLVFNASTLAVSTALAYYTYHLWPSHTDMAFPLASATLVYFFTNTWTVAGVVAATESKRVAVVWRSAYLWSIPYYLVGASLAAGMSYLSRYLRWEISLAALPVVFVVYRSYGLYLSQLQEQKRHAEMTASLHLRTIEALALAIEAKDQTTGEHLKRVQIYAREMAKHLRLTEDERLALQAASLLHDVGKLAIPDYILTKPGRLTPEEFERMKIHPIVGAEILERIDFPYPVVPIVRAHHEKWDGSGYPAGLKGDEIPIGARILSAVDYFDALASDRQYRRALPLEEAMEMVRAESGKSLDPRVVDVLGRRYLEFEALSEVEDFPEHAKLSLDAKIERGESPDAGFESGTPGVDSAPMWLLSLAQAHQQAQALYEFSRALGESLSLTETLAVIAARVKTILPYDAVAIYLVEGRALVSRYVCGEDYKLFAPLRIPLGQGVSGWVAENKRALLNGNPSMEPGYLNDPNRVSTLRSALAVPLEVSKTIGVLAVYRADQDAFSRHDLRTLLAVNSKFALAIENALACEKKNPDLVADTVTGLPNAGALFVHIESALRQCRRAESTLTVFVCDLDGFARVNDLHGHQAGDRVLEQIATGFRRNCREYDYLARMGGDEFVLVLPGLDAEGVAARVRALTSVVHKSGLDVCGLESLTVSVATAMFPRDGDDPETLLAEAERRMHASKQSPNGHAAASGSLQGLEAWLEAPADETPEKRGQTTLSPAAKSPN